MDPAASPADLALSIDANEGVLLATVSGRFTLSRALDVFNAICDTAVALHILARYGEAGLAYNVASGIEVSMSTVLEETLDIAGLSHAVRVEVEACRPMSGEISNRDRYEFGKEIAADQLSNRTSLKIALLGEEPVITGVGIVTAQIRGVNVELFSDRERALAWLARSLR